MVCRHDVLPLAAPCVDMHTLIRWDSPAILEKLASELFGFFDHSHARCGKRLHRNSLEARVALDWLRLPVWAAAVPAGFK